jgi:hypothetical protein
MITLKTFWKSLVDNATQPRMTRQQREIEDYLSQSVDRCDLERRERALVRKGVY